MSTFSDMMDKATQQAADRGVEKWSQFRFDITWFKLPSGSFRCFMLEPWLESVSVQAESPALAIKLAGLKLAEQIGMHFPIESVLYPKPISTTEQLADHLRACRKLSCDIREFYDNREYDFPLSTYPIHREYHDYGNFEFRRDNI